MKPLRIYVDTSVVGGCYDEEFTEDSRRFFDGARAGRLLLLLSDIVLAELEGAPQEVNDVLRRLPPGAIEYIPITDEVNALRDAYLDAGIVARKWEDDATHVAAATVSRADAIVSWNFRHIVRLDKIKGYNEINEAFGYRALIIITPKEVAPDDNEENQEPQQDL